MRIKDFNWIYHGSSKSKKLSIFSVDVQPFGNLVVTAGQDSTIKVWKKFFLFSGQKKKSKPDKLFFQKKKMLTPTFVIQSHKSHINIIRWALSGFFFASGGDDGSLIIYEKVKNTQQKQMWRIFYIFKNQTVDIIDMAWSPNSSVIATGSLDNCVYVWAVKKKCLIAKLVGHSSWIKGLCWDVTGEFMATQGADRKIIIWKGHNLIIHKILSLKNKKSCPKKKQKIDLFSRSYWTTCGEYLIVSNSFYRNKGSILMYSRTHNFKRIKCFLGQNLVFKTIRSNPRLFKKKETNQIISYFSTGSSSGNLFLWNPIFPDPNFSIFNLSKSQIVDISWCFCGYQLFISFLDGSVMGLEILKNEIEERLEKKNHFDFLKNYLFDIKNFFHFKNSNFSSKGYSRKETLIEMKEFRNFLFFFSKRPFSHLERVLKKISTKNLFLNPFVKKKRFYTWNVKIFKKNEIKSTGKLFINNKKNIFSNSACFISKFQNFLIVSDCQQKLLKSNCFFLSMSLLGKNKINLSLFLKKKKYIIKKQNGKDQIKVLAKIFFFSIQEDYLKIIDCGGNLKIFNFYTLFQFSFKYFEKKISLWQHLSCPLAKTIISQCSGLLTFL